VFTVEMPTACLLLRQAHSLNRIPAAAVLGEGMVESERVQAEPIEVSSILLVDDQPANLFSLRAVLDSPSYRVVEASSGLAALKLLLEQDFAVVLLDVHMPGMDGFEVAALAKRRPRSRHTPIIFVTAMDRDERKVNRGYEVGAIDFLHKPLEPDQVRAKVAGLVALYRRNESMKREAERLRQNDQRALDDRLAALDAVRERRYRNLAEAIPPMVWTSHADGSIDFCNSRWFDYTALNFDLARGWGWLAVLHPEDMAICSQGWRNAIASGEPYEVECRLRNATTGDYRWHLARALPERDEAGNILAWIGTFTDINDLKRSQAAEAQARSEAEAANHRLRFLARASRTLATSLDANLTLQSLAEMLVPALADLCTVDLVDEQGVLRRAATAPQQGALPGSELPQRALQEKPRIFPSVKTVVVEPGTLSDEHPAELRALGVRAYVRVPLRGRERLLGELTLASLGSGRRFLAADLELIEELAARAALALDNARLYERERKAVRDREEFLSIAAHELRTPLTALLLRVQAMGRLTREQLAGDQNTMAELSKRAAAQGYRMSALIDGLLDASRLSAGQLQLEREEVDLTKLVRDAAEVFLPELQRTTSVLSLEAEEPVVGSFDPMRLEQVVVNLLSNAAKYGGGKPIEVTVRRQEQRAVLTVRDQGIGIAPPDLERVFAPFHRTAAARAFPGVGLGLHVSRQLVEAHGGTVTAQSQVGQGTTFIVELPLS
jgi:PAS domain S-box-containing protein